MHIIDYKDISHKNDKMYSGAERKIGITINSEDFIVKFIKKDRFGLRNNHISEYLGSKIFLSLNINTQKVYQGYYGKEEVVLIKDFVNNGEMFVAFNDVGESSIDEDRVKFTYTYDGITQLLLSNNKLENKLETVELFWKLYVVDALIGNLDRHGANFGFIKKNNKYRLAPVFDNGSSLYPKLIDENTMLDIIDDEKETNKRIYEFPKSQILLNGKKSSYYDVINSLEYDDCNKALRYVYDNYDEDVIFKLIDETLFTSDIQKSFYKHMIKNRYEKIIKESYRRLTYEGT